MIQLFCPNPILVQRLYAGPLGAFIDTLVHQLLGQSYASWTAQYTMRLFADLRCWLQHHALTAVDLNEHCVDDFLQDRYRCYRVHRMDRPPLRRLLAHLREQGAIPTQAVATHPEPHDRLADDFQHHLLHQRGLAPTTVRTSLRTVRRFLRDRFGTRPLRLETLDARDVTAFMVQQTHCYNPTHAQLIATALRSFFCFLLQHGLITTDLAKAVPMVPTWRLSGLPRFMKAQEVADLLHSCDQSTPQGQRDYAILLLLARLGLRAGEVAALTLDDLDWEAGELLGRSKGARCDRLPLPHEVGAALVTYLREGRPPSPTRHVFVRMRAPRRGFIGSPAISTIVRRALERAGLNPAHKGAHLLRHSLATQLLHNGASLTEIGELLRHQDIETSRIYAKVDQVAWGALALPWPGGAV